MPAFGENGSRSERGAENGRMRQLDGAGGDQYEQPVGSAIELEGARLRIQYETPPQDSYLIVRDGQQLPSPSPTPSPRSTSPSLAISGNSREWNGSLSSISNSHQYDGASDKPAAPTSGFREREKRIISSPLPISKTLPSHELHDIPEEKTRRPRKASVTKVNGDERVLKLTAAEIEELTSAPESLPVTSPKSPRPSISGQDSLVPSSLLERRSSGTSHYGSDDQKSIERPRKTSTVEPLKISTQTSVDRRPNGESSSASVINRRPTYSNRGLSTPQASSARMPSFSKGQTSPKRKPIPMSTRPEPLDINLPKSAMATGKLPSFDPPHSPIPQSIPLPPMSIPTHLQLELSSSRPSPLYIYRSSTSDIVYESSKIKFERLLNFLLLPPKLEQVLYFGSLACLDAWLYTFTILPLRFFKAAGILVRWWGQVLAKEIRFITGFIYHGSGRMWHRQRDPSRSRSVSRARRPPASTNSSYQSQSGRVPEQLNGNANIENLKAEGERKSRQGWGRRHHRRTKSEPSSLSSNHKADLLQGAVIICSCIILMKLDASRMYHSIRGQSAIKLYVIYNVLEVCDKLFSALGQDIFECLFSDETLERDLDGRSKILRPFGMFILALIYNVIHAAALFYQVITLNVAVNSYSNALLTLLMSNQFVEIKGSVFKKIEKDNLFQLTCADVVERFQLWLMLMIIALRNIVEVGGLSMMGNAAEGAADFVKETIPIRSTSMLPNSFTILPSWTGEVLSPFLLVLGSEMLVDWVKHAYISKFNNVKPAVYKRYLDVLAKDYYTNAFVSQSLTKRLGLPVIPLSCLFIRSSVQTYHMFLATHLPPPLPSSATSLSLETPVTTAALEHFDTLIRSALGRSAQGIPNPNSTSSYPYLPTTDDLIAFVTMLVFFLGAFFVLLALKLVLGMLLLRFARDRYRDMKKREGEKYETEGKRLGGWGMVEVDEVKRKWIFDDDEEGLKRLREKEKAFKEKQDQDKGGGKDFEKISRYEMVKRIW